MEEIKTSIVPGVQTTEVLSRIAAMPDDLRDQLDASIKKNWDELIFSLIELAKGIWYEATTEEKDGSITKRVYRKLPDKEVAQYLVNQVIGKPKETQVMEGRVTFVRDF